MGDNIIQMYQFIGDINDTKVAGLESLLNYMNENFFSKDEPAVNEHRYHIIKNITLMKQMVFTMQIKVNIIIPKNRYTDEHYYKKTIHNKQFNELHNQRK